MKKGFSFILCCIVSVQFVFSQSDSSFQLLRVLKGDIVDFTVDNLDNIYILNSRNQIKKIDADGDSVAVYNDVKKFGTVSLIDVSNPLKLLLYYKDFATVVMLDRFLNIVNTIDLRKQNIYQAAAIAQSYDNKIWVFDELENKLKKIDEHGELLLETPDFRLLLDHAIRPIKIYDENKYVYLYDSLNGVNVFDYYGALKNNILITHWQNFKVAGKYIFGSQSDTLYRYNVTDFMYDEWKMPAAIADCRSFNFTTARVYALKENELKIYSINQ
ncbi:MAG: hypothetical protein R2796_01115 [Chitinophagaceae bacterium]|nr:hypothetical protein [Chitinophagaceae bacterium]MCB0739493.1 hypothetical protein [Chitinophagaceae bacterium]HQV05213.1 hypothetical protein [Chitinophagaceae bacterium]